MRNRFEGRDRDKRGHDSEDRGAMGHERGFGMANGNDGGFDRDPHRVDVHRRYGGRDDSMRDHAPRHGRLPKGYTRSDERIREDVCERLGMAVDASEVEVRVEGGVVWLTGSVLDRQTRDQLAEISERVPGVTDVQSHVTIVRSAQH